MLHAACDAIGMFSASSLRVHGILHATRRCRVPHAAGQWCARPYRRTASRTGGVTASAFAHVGVCETEPDASGSARSATKIVECSAHATERIGRSANASTRCSERKQHSSPTDRDAHDSGARAALE